MHQTVGEAEVGLPAADDFVTPALGVIGLMCSMCGVSPCQRFAKIPSMPDSIIIKMIKCITQDHNCTSGTFTKLEGPPSHKPCQLQSPGCKPCTAHAQ